MALSLSLSCSLFAIALTTFPKIALQSVKEEGAGAPLMEAITARYPRNEQLRPGSDEEGNGGDDEDVCLRLCFCQQPAYVQLDLLSLQP